MSGRAVEDQVSLSLSHFLRVYDFLHSFPSLFFIPIVLSNSCVQQEFGLHPPLNLACKTPHLKTQRTPDSTVCVSAGVELVVTQGENTHIRGTRTVDADIFVSRVKTKLPDCPSDRHQTRDRQEIYVQICRTEKQQRSKISRTESLTFHSLPDSMCLSSPSHTH